MKRKLAIGLLVLVGTVLGAVEPRRSFGVFPFANYETSTGVGVGIKALVKHYLKARESFDLILYAATRGERWVLFTFAIPDPDFRCGTCYPAALDLQVEFDRILNANFFGIGNDSPDSNRVYTHQFFRVEPLAGHAFTERIVGEIGPSMILYDVTPKLAPIPDTGQHLALALRTRLRLDARDNATDPRQGHNIVLQGDAGLGFGKVRLEANKYWTPLGKRHTLAMRLWTEQYFGKTLFYQKSSLGNTSKTLRGFPANRFMDDGMLMGTLEYRFPIWRIVGGAAFFDAGQVFPNPTLLRLDGFHANIGGGLRGYVWGFVVRADVGWTWEDPDNPQVSLDFGQTF